MKRVNLYEAKTHLSKLVATVEESGEPIVLCRSGRPVADLGPHKKEAPVLEPDPGLKGAKFTGDPCEGVPEEDWPANLR
jgi:antitoxin (DNA-binding transcriptional repressor) of toxin-antitoxin stability system